MKRMTIVLLSGLALAACGEAPTEVEQARPQALTFQYNDQSVSTYDRAARRCLARSP